jgi:dTDP-glucose pyrophosphorylase
MINKYLITQEASISKAILKLNLSGEKCLIVIDKKKKLIGTLSDGDIRKKIIKGFSVKNKIKNIYNKNPIYLRRQSFSDSEAKKIFFSKKIDLLPVVDKNLKVVKIITKNILKEKNFFYPRVSKDLGLFILAGGKGVRMQPFTNVFPKPLLPLNNKTVLDQILDNFYIQGFKKAYVSINYKSEIIQSYFKENFTKIKIKFIKEKNFLGTAGSIKFIKNKCKNFLVCNCDVITKFNLQNAYKFHKDNKNDITILSSSKKLQIPYGVSEIDEVSKKLINIIEKPTFNFFVNIGIYIIKNNIIKLIPDNQIPFDFPELIKTAHKKNKKVGTYSVNDDLWFDVGQWGDYISNIEKLK